MQTQIRRPSRPAASLRADARMVATARPEIQVRRTGSETEIYLYGEIGFYGISAGQIAEALDGARGQPVTLRINSPGGDVFDGLAIHSLLKTWDAPVRAQIDGVAASAASVVMLGASQIDMVRGSFVMVHNAWGVSIGNASEMRDFAGVLDQIDGNLAELYAGKSGGDVESWRERMDAETWLNAEQALASGIVDKIIDAPSVSASVAPGLYRNAPAALVAPDDKRAHMKARLELMRRMA